MKGFFELINKILLLLVCSIAILMLSSPSIYGEGQLSPAEQKIAWARKSIEAGPKNYQAYNDLALALSRKARETSDSAYYEQAEEALRQSFSLQPNNMEGLKMQVWILLGKHEFSKALEQAAALNRQMPDDILIYGFLVDANMELGNYEDAEKAAQWMLDMRPGNIPALTRAAYLREMFGDIDGAIELMNAAYQRTPPNELEDRAWILTHLAHLQLMTGKTENAEKLLNEALLLFPAYHYALSDLAKVRIAQKKYSEAADLLQKRYHAAPHPENLYSLAKALEKAGRVKQAKSAYAEFEKKARAEMQNADNSNRELIFYYADIARKPTEALRIAQSEISRRQDVYTLDAYAWALYRNRKYAEAYEQIEKALAVGIRDATLFYHTGAIALKLNDRKSAAYYLKQSLDMFPQSEMAADVRRALARLRWIS